MEAVRPQKTEEREDRAPADEGMMASLVEQVPDIEDLERSDKFHKIAKEDFEDFLKYLQGESSMYSSFVYVGQTSKPTVGGKGLHTAHTQPRDLEESWVLVNDTVEARAFQANHNELQRRPSMFNDWPSFGVYDKMSVVVASTGAMFMFGYTVAAKTAIESLFRFLGKYPTISWTTGVATALFATTSPELAISAAKYIIIGGTAAATPILVVGTSGIFVAASIYHSFELAKRVGKKAIGY